jgi:hypothetical protein
MSAVMPAMRAVAAAPLEASTSAIRAAITAPIRAPIRTAIRTTVATTVTVAAPRGPIGAPIRASAASSETATITAAVASAALRALEAGARIGADAGEILARCVRIARAAGFAGQKHGVIFHNCFDGGSLRDRGRHGFRRDVFDGFVVSEVGALGFGQLRAIFLSVGFLACFALMFLMAGFRRELCFVGFVFRIFAVFAFFTLILLFFGFFFVVAMFLALGNFVRFVQLLRFVFVKIRATDERVGFGARLGLFVLGFHQAGGERYSLFIAEASGAVADRPGWGLFCVMLRSGSQGFLSGFRGVLFRGRFSSGRIRFRIG